MKQQKPGILKMVRAPFLSSIIAPLVAGILLAGSINGHLDLPGVLLVFLLGIGLHVATNVYNDIYDTLQGTDKVNVHRNASSGGSGVLQDFPELMPRMYLLARAGLVLALVASTGLMFFVDPAFWPHLWVLFLLSAFFSKYYTAPPFKLAYRGWGEVSVWFAFGPMAVLIAAVSQNIGLHPWMMLLMPVTGLSTLSILLAGQLIDVKADRAGGKHGVASRLGTRATAWIYLFVQGGILVNVLVLFFFLPGQSWPLLLGLIPYLLVFPRAGCIIFKFHDQEDRLKEGAKLTVLTHLGFSVFLIAGLALYFFLSP